MSLATPPGMGLTEAVTKKLLGAAHQPKVLSAGPLNDHLCAEELITHSCSWEWTGTSSLTSSSAFQGEELNCCLSQCFPKENTPFL